MSLEECDLPYAVESQRSGENRFLVVDLFPGTPGAMLGSVSKMTCCGLIMMEEVDDDCGNVSRFTKMVDVSRIAGSAYGSV